MSPQEPRKLMDEGIQLFKKGKHEEACEKLLDLVSAHPDSDLADNAYYNLGQIYLKMEEFSKAYVCFKAVMDRYPDSDAAQFAGDYLDEVKNRADPSAGLYEKAQTAYIDGDLVNSEKLFTHLVKESPHSDLADNAWFYLGVLHFRQGNKAASAEAFRVVREQYPDSDAARLLRNSDR